MRDVVCIGAATVDIAASSVDETVFQKEKQYIDDIGISVGGDAANQAVTLAMLGRSVSLCSCIGDDLLGGLLKTRLSEIGVNTALIKCRDNISTTAAISLVGQNGRRNIITVKGAHRSINRMDIPMKILDETRAITLGSIFSFPALEDDGLMELLMQAKKKDVLVFADMGTDNRKLGMDGVRRFLPYIDYFLPSRKDAENLTGEMKPELMAAKLRQAGAGCVVLKLGEQGCLVVDGNGETVIPAFNVKSVDTTGAGDCFVGAYTDAILSGLGHVQAAKRACAAAAISVKAHGATPVGLSAKAIDELLK